MTSEEIKLIKLGAQKIDKLDATMGMKNNQCFHGGGNYVANTQYLYSMYRKYIKKKDKIKNKKVVYKKLTMLKYTKVFNNKDPYAEAKNEMKKKSEQNGETAKSFEPYDIKKRLNKTQEIIFKDFIGKNKSKWTYEKRAYIMLGMAIHTATDAFSHRAYKVLKINGRESIWQTVHKSIDNKKKKISVSKVWAELNSYLSDDEQKKSIYAELMDKAMIADTVSKLYPLYRDSLLLAQKILGSAKSKKAKIYSCYKEVGAQHTAKKYKVANFRKYLKKFTKVKKKEYRYINYEDKDYTINFKKESIVYAPQEKRNGSDENNCIKMKYNSKNIYGVRAVNGESKVLLKEYKIENGYIYFYYADGKIDYSEYNKIWVTIIRPLATKTYKVSIKVGDK